MNREEIVRWKSGMTYKKCKNCGHHNPLDTLKCVKCNYYNYFETEEIPKTNEIVYEAPRQIEKETESPPHIGMKPRVL